jgi:hypothetical protein
MSVNRTTADEDGLEAYFELFGDRFRDATAAASSTTPRRPRRRWAVGVVALACAAAIVLMSILPGTAGTHAVSVVAQAQAALAPAGEIVHMTVDTTTYSDGSTSTSRAIEQWSAIDPERWRLVQTIEPSSTSTVRDRFGGVILGREELSYDGGVLRRFLTDRGILDVTTTNPRRSGVFGILGGADPATELRAALASGTVTDEGEQQIGRRTVRRIVTMRGTGRQAHHFTYDVDPETYAPVQGQLTIAETPDVVFQFHVDSYERLALTPQNARLLTIATNAATTVRGEKGP